MIFLRKLLLFVRWNVIDEPFSRLRFVLALTNFHGDGLFSDYTIFLPSNEVKVLHSAIITSKVTTLPLVTISGSDLSQVGELYTRWGCLAWSQSRLVASPGSGSGQRVVAQVRWIPTVLVPSASTEGLGSGSHTRTSVTLNCASRPKRKAECKMLLE